MMGRRQDQHGGDSSNNYQAGGNIHVGLSLDEARQVAMDTFRANFVEFRNEAFEQVVRRADELVTAFLEEVQKEGSNSIPEGRNPDFQYALYGAQKAYARTGDEDLGALLVQLLVDRSKVQARDLEQIVLNESLEVVSKLTPDQLDTLALVFTVRYSFSPSVDNLDALENYLSTDVAPFVREASRNRSAYQHLEFAGCGAISFGQTGLHRLFTARYGGLLSMGMSEEQLNEQIESLQLVLTTEQKAELFISGLHDDKLVQVNALNERDLTETAERLDLPPSDVPKLKTLFQTGLMRPDQTRDYCVRVIPEMAELFQLWEETQIKSLSLTSVGMAIAHANIKRKTGADSPLAEWM